MKIGQIFERKDIALIHLNNFYDWQSSFFSVGMLYIATLLKQNGYQVLCISPKQFMVSSLEQIKSFIRITSPKIVGFHTLADNILQVKALADSIKHANPSVKIVVGGPQASSLEEKILDASCFDIAVVGEGEYTMLELADYFLKQKGDLKQIKGIVYKKDGEIIKTPPREPIADLNKLPFPDYSLISSPRVFYPVIAGRGCPYNCIFCFKGVYGSKYRFRTPENTVEEIISQLEAFNIKVFCFLDDTFTVSYEQTKKICELLIRYKKLKKGKFIFYCEGRVDVLASHLDLLDILHQAGLERLQIGIESGNQKILNLYEKHITLEQVEKVVAECSRLGISGVVANFILGGPSETEETITDSINFAKKLIESSPGVFYCATSFLAPYPGTKIYSQAEKYGLVILDKDFETSLSVGEPHVRTNSLSEKDLRRLRRVFIEEINKSMKKVLSKIPVDILKKHFQLARDYSCLTNWHEKFLKNYPILVDYFNFMQSPRFCFLKDIPNENWKEFYPMRTQAGINYGSDGDTMLLTGSYKSIKLLKPLEKFIYKYSIGKLPLKEVALRVKSEFNLNYSPDEIWKKILKPFYRKTEKSFYVTFYK